MCIKNLILSLLGSCTFIFMILFPAESYSKTYKTDHYNFSVGWLSGYNEEEKKTISELVANLDVIWMKVNWSRDRAW